MLQTPKHGWSQITIKDWSDRLSYLDDVAYMLLEAVWNCLRMSGPECVKFDAEGYEYILVIDQCYSYVITMADSDTLTVLDITLREIAQELISDIRRDMEDWVSFVDYGDMTEDQKNERRKDMTVLCDLIAERLKFTPDQTRELFKESKESSFRELTSRHIEPEK